MRAQFQLFCPKFNKNKQMEGVKSESPGRDIIVTPSCSKVTLQASLISVHRSSRGTLTNCRHPKRHNLPPVIYIT